MITILLYAFKMERGQIREEKKLLLLEESFLVIKDGGVIFQRQNIS